MLRAGILTERIELYKLHTEISEYGDTLYNYKWFYSTRARILFKKGTKTIDDEEISYPNSKKFTVRYYVPVEETMRIKYLGKWYQILSIEKMRSYNQIEIIAELINTDEEEP